MSAGPPAARVIPVSGGGGESPRDALEQTRALGAVVTLDKPFDIPEAVAAAGQALVSPAG